AQAPVTLEVPRERAHGDYSTNVAMVTARTVGLKPRDWAERIVSRIDTAGTFIDRVEVAGPGFINFYLRPQWLYGVLDDVLALGPRYGDTHVGQGRRVVVEFVSANPTGPLNVVNARHAALGDSLASLLAAAGYRVAREFYVNDAGNQFRMLALAPRYGAARVGQGGRVVVEFVSANPTGPLNVVNARHAALGDSLASLLAAAGYRVAREFYVNDAGNQFRMLALAMDTRLRELL